MTSYMEEVEMELFAASKFVSGAYDHALRARRDQPTPDQQRSRTETAASDIASATQALSRAAWALAMAVVRGEVVR